MYNLFANLVVDMEDTNNDEEFGTPNADEKLSKEANKDGGTPNVEMQTLNLEDGRKSNQKGPFKNFND